jgi:hypothetical protein
MYSENQRRTMRTIEADVGCKFERIAAPQMEEVLHASTAAAKAVIQRVNPEVSKVFLSTAERLLEKEGPAAFAAALAHMSGFSQLPAPRSLITHEEVMIGWAFLERAGLEVGWACTCYMLPATEAFVFCFYMVRILELTNLDEREFVLMKAWLYRV